MGENQVMWSAYGFEGKLVRVRLDTVNIPGTGLREREIVEHPGAVGIIPVLQDGRIVLVRQFRPAVSRALLEVPAGTVEPGEAHVDTARRELVEETGYEAGALKELVRFFVSPGWCTEELVLYVATDVQPGERNLEDDEDIDVVTVEPADVPLLIQNGEIGDAKTMVGLSTYLGFHLTPRPA